MMKTIKPSSPLFILASVFAISAILRIALHADTAWAVVEKISTPAPTIEQGVTCGPDIEIEPILAQLTTRQQELDARAATIVENESALALIKTELNQQLQELEQAEARLADMISMSQSASQNDLTQLTAVYSAMNPKQAAALFETMDPEFAAGFLTLLDPQIAGEILAGVSAEKAYALSVIVAGRNATAPTE